MRKVWLVTTIALFVALPSALGADPLASRTVDCDKGQTIGDALLQANDNSLLVQIKGTCHEDVTLHRDNVTFQGISPDATVVGSFTIDGKSQIALQNFTIREGDKCVWILGDGSASIVGMQILNCRTRGILVHSGSALVQDTTVDHAHNVGIFVRGGQINLAGRVESSNCGFSGFGATLGGALSAGSQIFGPPA